MRGKIRAMFLIFVVLQAVCALGVFFAASRFAPNYWVPAVICIGISVILTLFFGWWLAGEVLKPLDTLTLLAKSIERNPAMSVPNTTGAVETDDLLHTVSRASRQLANFVDMMDEVTAGNTRAALDPLQHSDRLSESFQKFVAKVTDSIDAKNQLDELQQAIIQISAELSGLPRGELVRVRNEYRGTRTITDALRYLLERQELMTGTVAANTGSLKTLIKEGKNRVATAQEKGAASKRTLEKLRSGLDEVRIAGETAARDASTAALSISNTLNDLTAKNPDTASGSRTTEAVGRQFEAAIHKLRTVGEQTLSISHVARSIQDLSNRTSLVAVNASISASGDRSEGLGAITHEMKLLAERAEKANRAIAAISDSVVRDVNETNASIHWISAEVGKLITRAEKAEKLVGTILDNIKQFETFAQTSAESSGLLGTKAARHAASFDEFAASLDTIRAELASCEVAFEMFAEPLGAIRSLVIAEKHSSHADERQAHPTVDGTGPQPNGNGILSRDLITLPSD